MPEAAVPNVGGRWVPSIVQVKAEIEKYRAALGLGTHQVLFNTDLYGRTSATYYTYVSSQCHPSVASREACSVDGVTTGDIHRYRLSVRLFFWVLSGVKVCVSWRPCLGSIVARELPDFSSGMGVKGVRMCWIMTVVTYFPSRTSPFKKRGKIISQ